MGRPKGSKNLPKEAIADEQEIKKVMKKATKKTVKKVVKKTTSPPEVPQPEEPSLRDVLGAISNLGSYVGQLAERVENIEANRITTSVTASESVPNPAPPPVNFTANQQTMVVDTGMDAPPPPDQMALVEEESYSVLQASGFTALQEKQISDKGVQVKPLPGRKPVPSKKDVKCAVCGAAPPPRAGYVCEGAVSVGQRGTQTRYVCERCLSGGMR